MGREKKNKPRKRRSWEPSALEHALNSFTRDSLWTLLGAAGRAAGVRHRWASITYLVAVVANLRGEGTAIAKAKDLPMLLRLAHEDMPGLSTQEDFMPEDPRDVALFEFDGCLYRLFGGNVERPVADIERVITLDRATHDVLVSNLGFSLREVIEVVLQHTDAVLARSVTPDRPLNHTVGDIEITFESREIVEEPGDPEWTGAHAAAIRWLTSPASELEYESGAPMSTFGSTMRTILPGDNQPRWLPLELIPEALGAAASMLAEQAASIDDQVRRQFAQLSIERAKRRLWRFSPTIMGGPDGAQGPGVSQEDVASWVCPMGYRDALAVQVISTFGEHAPDQEPVVVRASKALGAGAETFDLPFANGQMPLKPGMRLIPILVYAGTGHLITMGPPGALHMSIEDLDWIAASAHDEVDLFHFADEMSQSNLPKMFALETINAWDWWQNNNGALFRSGRPADAMMFEFHRGTVEWERAIRLSPIEEALCTLRARPLRDWDLVIEHEEGPPTLAYWGSVSSGSALLGPGRHTRASVDLTTIHLSEVPVSIRAAPTNSNSKSEADAIQNLAGAFAYSLSDLDEIWVDVARSANVRGLQITLTLAADGAQLFDIGDVSCEAGIGSVSIDVSIEKLVEIAGNEVQAGQIATADLFKSILMNLGAPDDALDHLRDAWIASPPSLSVMVYDSSTSRNEMPLPIEIEKPLEAGIDRLLAKRLREAGVEPRRYSPEEAKDLDRDTLAPAALETLRKRISKFKADDLIRNGMIQMERTFARRENSVRDIRRAASALPVAWDPIERQREVSSENLKLRRTIELAIEAVLLEQPAGSLDLDDRAWAEVLAAASGYFDATTRSESLHYQVARTSLDVSDSYDLELVGLDRVDGDPMTIDYRAFSLDKAEEDLKQSWIEASESEALAGLLMNADELFLRAYGVLYSDIVRTLRAIASWPLREDDPDAITITVAEVETYVSNSIFEQPSDAERDRVTAVIEFLQSRAGDYQREDWVPWRLRSRSVRLFTRPLVAMSDGQVIVAPHFCKGVSRAYLGYWSNGQLPWSLVHSFELEAALQAVRDHRNLELERQIDALLRSDSWSTVSRIKPGDGGRIGVGTLTTEIDIVAGRPGSGTIFVLEVKDPAPVYAPADIRRLLNRFHDGPKSYSKMLERKLNEVSVDPGRVAAALGLPPDRQYRVEARFVTRRVASPAYAGGPFEFITSATLLEALSEQGADPTP